MGGFTCEARATVIGLWTAPYSTDGNGLARTTLSTRPGGVDTENRTGTYARLGASNCYDLWKRSLNLISNG